MNQFLIRKALGVNFQYKQINTHLSLKDIEKGKDKLNRNFTKIICGWSENVNSEWVVRNYLAVKMIMSSTVMLTSLSYGNERNIRITEPYLIYYSLLNICRAVLFTSPTADWKSGGIKEESHSKIINIVSDIVSQFNRETGEWIKETLKKAKEHRELFSYKFPANGIKSTYVSFDEAVDVCRFLAEIAQLQSEVLENINFKTPKVQTLLDINVLQKAFTYEGATHSFIDDEDWYRINYSSRKQPFPVNLYFTLTEGMVDDYFGAWCDDSSDDESDIDKYNPDDENNLIFPMP